MTIYTKSNTFSANTVIASANVNQNFNEISTAINTTLCGGGNAVVATAGGTGQTTITTGDVLYGSASNVISKLGIGSAGNFLGISGGIPAWATPSTNIAVTTKTANYTLLATDDLILCNTNAFTITLPAASASSGKIYRIQKIGSDSNAITIARAGSDTIDGLTSVRLATRYDAITIISDGSATWYVLASTSTIAGLFTGAPPTGTLNSSFNTVTFGTTVTNTHAAYASGTYTIPVAGFYDISAQVDISGTFTAAQYGKIAIAVSGTPVYDSYCVAGNTSLGEVWPSICVTGLYFAAGATVSIQAGATGTGLSYTSDATTQYFSIRKVGN